MVENDQGRWVASSSGLQMCVYWCSTPYVHTTHTHTHNLYTAYIETDTKSIMNKDTRQDSLAFQKPVVNELLYLAPAVNFT